MRGPALKAALGTGLEIVGVVAVGSLALAGLRELNGSPKRNLGPSPS